MSEKRVKITVPPDIPPTRLDRYLGATELGLSRSQIQKLIREKLIEVPGKGIKPAFILFGGEEIYVTIPESEPLRLLPENIPLDIRYEDDYLVVVNKPAGMVVHPARGHFTGTLVHALLGHVGELSGIGGQTRPGVVHRLDKNTSGLIIFAKNDLAHSRLSRALAARKIEREYIGFVWGRLKEAFGTIEGAIGHNPKDHKRMAVVESGRPARTDFVVERDYDLLSAVKFHLQTGRTHQIRVHCQHIGHPIFGDPDYGGREGRIGGSAPEYRRFARELLSKIDRQALHARHLTFDHPITSEKISIEAPLPPDMESVLQALERWSA
ncbi:RluA family pseudouridine synthase [bacterium]|nr:RluA family pseudouridine synthase [bacterium]